MALKSANQPIRWWKRIGIIGIGLSAKQVEALLFDELLYGTVVSYITTKLGWVWGPLASFAVLGTFSAIMCLWYMRLYDRAGKDWFGFEAAKELRDGLETGGRMMRLTQRVMRLGDIPAFFAILFLHPSGDPFMAVVYLRKGAGKYNGLTKRDWRIFWAAVVVSNGYWTLRWTALVAMATKLFWPVVIKPMLHWFGYG
jgi:hypothetical protein